MAAARRHSVVTSVLAGVVAALGTVVVLVTATVAGLGLPAVAMACAPLLAACAALLVLLAGELTWPRQRGATRTAVLHDRSPGSVVRGRWPTAAVLSLLVTAVGLVGGGLLADADGHSISRTTATTAHTAGPFPGWHYAVPQLELLLGFLGLAAVVGLAVGGLVTTHVLADGGSALLLARAAMFAGPLVELLALAVILVPVPRLPTPAPPADAVVPA